MGGMGGMGGLGGMGGMGDMDFGGAGEEEEGGEDSDNEELPDLVSVVRRCWSLAISLAGDLPTCSLARFAHGGRLVLVY